MMWSPTGLMSSDRASMTGHAGFEVGTYALETLSSKLDCLSAHDFTGGSSILPLPALPE